MSFQPHRLREIPGRSWLSTLLASKRSPRLEEDGGSTTDQTSAWRPGVRWNGNWHIYKRYVRNQRRLSPSRLEFRQLVEVVSSCATRARGSWRTRR